MDRTKLLEEYSQLLDGIAWYGKGDVLELAKMAKKLRRSYMQDLAERKAVLAADRRISYDFSGSITKLVGLNQFFLARQKGTASQQLPLTLLIEKPIIKERANHERWSLGLHNGKLFGHTNSAANTDGHRHLTGSSLWRGGCLFFIL